MIQRLGRAWLKLITFHHGAFVEFSVGFEMGAFRGSLFPIFHSRFLGLSNLLSPLSLCR